jgi:hypothetical protein
VIQKYKKAVMFQESNYAEAKAQITKKQASASRWSWLGKS